MSRLTTSAIAAAAVCGLLTVWTATAIGQAPASADAGKGAIVGTGTFTAFVENMDRSLAFYHDVFGMEVPPIPAAGERAYNRANPQLFAMFDIPGARERHQSARVPGTRISLEVMEVLDVAHQTIPLRIQDPGTATLVLVVRDINATLARVKQAKVPVVTPGGKPVTLADGARAVLIRDIDNRFIELRQPASIPEATAPATTDIIDMRLSIAVGDMDRTTQVYRDVLGFTVEGETAFAADKAVQALTGLSNAEVRRSRVQAPGSTLWIEFVEFKGVERTPLKMRIQDRGAARLQLRAQNLDAMVARMKAAGLTIVSEGAVAVPIPPNLKGALVADPNNFFLTPFGPCDGCAPGLQAQPRQGAARPSATLPAQDVLDIQALVSRYGYVLDSGAEGGGAEGGRAYADLFTDDGVFASPQTTVTGREALLKFASGHRPGQGPAYVRNFAMNMLVEPAPEGARGKVYAVVIAIGENAPGQQGAESSIFTGGHFEDTYAKTANGWRFKRRQFVPSEGGPTTNVGVAAQSRTAPALSALDRLEIQQLVARYAYALDTGGRNGYEYADLFAPDGVFVGMNQGTAGRLFRGRDTLASLARGGQRNPNFVSHFITNVIVEPTADGARGTQYAIIGEIGGTNGSKGRWTHGGHYEDQYVKTAAGWRFKSRVFYASEGGPAPRQLQNDPMKAPVAPAANPAPEPRTAPPPPFPGRLTADDYIAIQQLVVNYPYALDTGGNNGYYYADLFTADAEFSRPLTKGRDNLAKLALDQPHGPNYVRHYITNHVIEPTADGAIGKEYLVVIDIGEAGKPSSIFVGGHYEDVYAQTADGWRFKRREFIPTRSATPAPAAPRAQ